MWRSILAEIRALDTGRRALRNFGLVVGVVFAAVALVIAWRRGWETGPLVLGLGVPGGLLMVLGLVVPTVLRPLYRVWMGIAVVLGYIMTRVILTVVFVGLVIPIGLLLRLFGKDLLHRKIDRGAVTYWQTKVYADDSPDRLEKYF